MGTATRPASDKANVLRGVPWEVYDALRDLPENDYTRMTYHDGTLILTSPQYRHDKSAVRIGLMIRSVVAAFGIPVAGARTTTLKRRGEGRKKGVGKEPDDSYYIANEARLRD